MSRHLLNLGGLTTTDLTCLVERILEILIVPIITFIIIAQSLYGVGTGLGAGLLILTAIYSLAFLLRRPSAARLNWIDWSLVVVVVCETTCYFSSTYKDNSLRNYKDILFLFLFYCFVRLNLKHQYQQVSVFLLVSLFGLYLSVAAIFLFHRQYSHLTSLGLNELTNFKRLLNFQQSTGLTIGEWITIYLVLLPFPFLLFMRFINTLPATAWFFLCPALTILFAILVTFSRGIYIATAVFFIVLYLLYRVYNATQLRVLIRFSVCTFLLLIFILGATNLIRPVLTTGSLFQTTSQSRSYEGREVVWKESLAMIKDHPLSGVGSLNFPMEYVAYKGEDSPFVGRTFNIFLQLLVEKGVIGLLAYCLLFFSFFKVSRDNIQLLPDNSFQKASAVLFMASFAAVLVRDLSYPSILTNNGVGTVLWFVFANNACSDGGSAEVHSCPLRSPDKTACSSLNHF
jgi:putative inorganic carbon (HCO3(-)) transporter